MRKSIVTSSTSTLELERLIVVLQVFAIYLNLLISQASGYILCYVSFNIPPPKIFSQISLYFRTHKMESVPATVSFLKQFLF